MTKKLLFFRISVCVFCLDKPAKLQVHSRMDIRQQYVAQFSQNETVHKVIQTIDTAQDMDTNLALLLSTKIKRDELLPAVGYIKDNFVAKYPVQIDTAFKKITNIKKAQLYYQFVAFVQQTIPTLCLMCNTDYTPLHQEASANGDVECIRCKTLAHNQCYKAEDFDHNIGKVFICQCCIQDMGKEEKKKTEDEEEKDGKEEKDKKVDSSSDSSSDSSTQNSDSDEDSSSWTEKRKKKRKKSIAPSDEDKSKKKKSKKKNQVCPKLLEGICPHGAVGKDCEFTHKKKCHRFINFGSQDNHRGGCKFGEDCFNLHPKLCQNSVSMNTCYNENCKLVHLKFTKRKPPREENDSRSYSNSFVRNRGQSNNPRTSSNPRSNGYEQRNFQPKQQSYNKYHQNSSWNDSQKSNTFLEETMQKFQQSFLQSMKQLMEAQFWKAEETYNTEFPPMQQHQW